MSSSMISPPRFSDSLSLNPELANLARPAGHRAPKSLLFLSPALGLQACSAAPGFFISAGDLHVCAACTFY